MIKRYAIYFAIIASGLMFFVGLTQDITTTTLLLRTVIVFFGTFVFGNFLGVITIEALLEKQDAKVKLKEEAKAAEKATKQQAAATAPKKEG